MSVSLGCRVVCRGAGWDENAYWQDRFRVDLTGHDQPYRIALPDDLLPVSLPPRLFFFFFFFFFFFLNRIRCA
jgi:hypothetical protein